MRVHGGRGGASFIMVHFHCVLTLLLAATATGWRGSTGWTGLASSRPHRRAHSCACAAAPSASDGDHRGDLNAEECETDGAPSWLCNVPMPLVSRGEPSDAEGSGMPGEGETRRVLSVL